MKPAPTYPRGGGGSFSLYWYQGFKSFSSHHAVKEFEIKQSEGPGLGEVGWERGGSINCVAFRLPVTACLARNVFVRVA